MLHSKFIPILHIFSTISLYYEGVEKINGKLNREKRIMIYMMKRIAGLALALTLIASTPAFAAEKSEKALPAAPAIAFEILESHGVKPTGDILKLVAAHMETYSSFMGISKDDPMYRHEVMHFLHCELEVIEMEHDECMHHGMTE